MLSREELEDRARKLGAAWMQAMVDRSQAAHDPLLDADTRSRRYAQLTRRAEVRHEHCQSVLNDLGHYHRGQEDIVRREGFHHYRAEDEAQGPGMFQGEPRWAPFMLEDSLENPHWVEDGSTETSTWVGYRQVTNEDVDRFPELNPGWWIALEQDGQGFVHSFHTEEQPEVTPAVDPDADPDDEEEE